MDIDNSKLNLKTKKKERQIEVCKKYDLYLKIIHEIGDSIMFQDILNSAIITVLELNIKKSELSDHLKELENLDIIKRVRYSNTGYKVIILRNFGIRYVTDKINDSKSQASLPKINSEDKFKKNRMKTKYIVQGLNRVKINRRLADPNFQVSYANLIAEFKAVNSSVLLKLNDGVNYLMQIKKTVLKSNLNRVEFDEQYETEALAISKMKNNLSKEKGEFLDEKKIEKYTFMKMKKQDMDIESVFFDSKTLTLNLKILYFAYEEKYSIKEIDKLLTNMSEVISLFKQMINKRIGEKIININITCCYLAGNREQCEKFNKVMMYKRSYRQTSEKISRVDHLFNSSTNKKCQEHKSEYQGKRITISYRSLRSSI